MNRGLGTALLAVALVSGAVDLAFARAGGRRAAAGGVPNFDVGPSCRASSSPDCAIQEQTAHDMLIKKWPGFTAQVKATCAGHAKEAGPPSYVEWLTCLETYENMRKFSATQNSATPDAKTGSALSATHRSHRRSGHRGMQ